MMNDDIDYDRYHKIMQKFFVGLADNFQQIDTNNDGMVTAEEMSKAIPNRKIGRAHV